MSGNYNARSRFKLRDSANVVWSCLWDGSVAIGTRAVDSVNYFFKSTVTGTDSRGHSGTELATLFGSTGAFEGQYIIVDSADITPVPREDGCDAVWSVTTTATDAPGGKGNKIVVLQKKRSAAINTGSQPQFQMIGNLVGSTRRSICIKQKFKLPSNLSDILDSYAAGTGTRWMEFFAVKNGNTGDPNSATDSRFTIQAVRMRTNNVDETGMKYMFQFDSGSGGGTNFWGTSLYSAEGSLVPGVWHEFTMYIEQPATGGVNNLTDGIFRCKIQNLVTGDIVADVSKYGGQFYGPLERKLTRISPVLCYTGGWPATGTIQIEFSDLEISENPRYPLT